MKTSKLNHNFFFLGFVSCSLLNQTRLWPSHSQVFFRKHPFWMQSNHAKFFLVCLWLLWRLYLVTFEILCNACPYFQQVPRKFDTLPDYCIDHWLEMGIRFWLEVVDNHFTCFSALLRNGYFFSMIIDAFSLPGIEYFPKYCWGLTILNIFRFFIRLKYVFPCASNEEKSHNIPMKSLRLKKTKSPSNVISTKKN